RTLSFCRARRLKFCRASGGSTQPAAWKAAPHIGIQVTMKTIRSYAASCVTILLAAMLLVQLRPLPAAAASARDEPVIAFLQKRSRLPSTRNITLGPPVKTPFAKVMSRTVTITDDGGASAKVTIFTEPGVAEIIVGEVLDLSSDPWGR